MGGFWPFKKKPPEPEGQKIVTYSADDNSAEELLSDRSHIEDEQYKAALDLLTKPHIELPDGGDPSIVKVLDSTSSDGEFVQSDDGYWYRMKEDGTFNPKPYIKNDDGDFSEYSE